MLCGRRKKNCWVSVYREAAKVFRLFVSFGSPFVALEFGEEREEPIAMNDDEICQYRLDQKAEISFLLVLGALVYSKCIAY